MAEIILKLKLVSPLLMFGAFNGGQTPLPEIRAASIRGGLRYWLRAVYGATYGSNITGLHEAESRIFGSTSRGSAITVRVQHSLTGVSRKEFFVLPEKVDSRNGKVDHRFPGFSDSETFDLALISHPLRRDVFNPAFISALFLAFTLGGFGKRARRGGGALQVVGYGDDVPDILHPLDVQNGEALAKALTTEVFPYIERAVAGLPGTPYAATVVPAYPIFAPDHCRVFVGKQPSSDYLAALKQMWRITGTYHRMTVTRRNRDGREETVPERWAWGYAIGKQRRASALHMRVYQCGDGKYYPFVTFFRGGRSAENWGQVQDVVDEFAKPANNFIRAYGNTTRW